MLSLIFPLLFISAEVRVQSDELKSIHLQFITLHSDFCTSLQYRYQLSLYGLARDFDVAV